MDPVWTPHVIQNLKDSELGLYLEFSCTACIPGGGCHVETALQVLYQSNGDLKVAMQRLLDENAHNLAVWTLDEVHLFEQLILIYGKNFYRISSDIKSKTVKECVEFYYLWKHSPLRSIPLNQTKLPPTSSTTSSAASLATSSSTPNGANSTASDIIATNGDSNNNNNQNNHNNDTNNNNTSNPISLTPVEEWPCKVCGRVFLKIKSRSAHMKRHKNEK